MRMAAADSGPHLGSPTPAAPDARPASAPPVPVPCGGTLGRAGYASVPAARAAPLQVDVAVALPRGRSSEKYGRSYLCLLQAVFVAGKFPPRARRRAPQLPPPPLPPLLPQPGWRAGDRAPHPLPHCRGDPPPRP